jgi:cytidylate kinase
MSVVIIYADSYCRGEEIAERAAGALEYECISREVMRETARTYEVPEQKLEEAMKDTRSFLNRLSSTQARYMAYFQACFVAAVKRGNLVYHGEAGHMFISGVSHILKVKLTADLEERVALRMEKEGHSERKARELLLRESERRQKWFRSVFGGDGTDSSRFDLVINTTQIGPERAANIIAETARDVKFRPITYSVKALQDQELASRIRATLIDSYPDVTVRAKDGEVSIGGKSLKRQKKDRILSVREQVQGMEGVSYVELG